MEQTSKTYAWICIYGPPGSGKSAMGRVLAANLGLPFYDLDVEVESAAGTTIAEIFAGQGEAAFRRLEQEILARVLRQPAGVLALGGGSLLDSRSRERVEAAGQVLCLLAATPVLLERVQLAAAQRPLLAGDLASRLPRLLAERQEHYASFPRRLAIQSWPVAEVAWQAQLALGRFQVRGMGTDYDVIVHSGGLEGAGEWMRSHGLGGPVMVVSDQNVAALHAGAVSAALRLAGYAAHLATFPAGERYKTIETVGSLWEAFLKAGIERSSTILALGGGVASDMAGFAAATYLRGVPWVCVPTSVLAMADASLGGKTGVDLAQGKNLVGAFYPPRFVLADPRMLRTLPEAEARSGLAEVVKAGVIGDPLLFQICRQGWQAVQNRLEEVICRCMGVKVRVIQEDPYEKGVRAALNLGHTVGHALELLSGFALRHGEAVAIGIVAESRMAERLGLAASGLAGEIEAALAGLGLPTQIPASISPAQIVPAMRVDKKRAAGKVRFALPVEIGEVRVTVEIEDIEGLLKP